MSETTILVPGDVTTVDKRRFRVVPLNVENIDRAGIGELAVDDSNGDIYVIDKHGQPVCRTANLEETVNNIIRSDYNTLSFMYNHNRRVYRLFFNNESVRLDTNLILDDSCAYYRVRDLADNGIYYVANLTPIKEEAMVVKPLVDNENYFVEFYNKKKEMISMFPFSAKAALYFDSVTSDSETISYIKIYTNKDYMFVGEDVNSLMAKVYAVYEDGSEKEITEYSTVDIDYSEVDFSKAGKYLIKATWVYDVENILTMEATKEVEIREDKSMTVSDVVVTPRKIINLNDGSKEIKLMVIAYYADGTVLDVSDNCIVTNFDSTLFNQSQTIVVKLNAGTINVYSQTYEICVTDSGQASNFRLYYNEENILELDDSSRDTTPYNENALFFRVRDAYDLNTYYTPIYSELHYSTLFSETDEETLTEGKNVIVEFYDNDKNLLDSDVYVCEYKKDI